MGHPVFAHADFLDAARAIAAEHGPAAVTVGSVGERLKAPKGSFYHRFASRDALLGELWLGAVLDYQQGFLAAAETSDWRGAALHMPAWVRAHLEDARLLLLYSRHDFVKGDWPEPLKAGVAQQAQRFQTCLDRCARDLFGSDGPDAARRAQFILADLPAAATRPHLQRREPPPPIVEELIATAFDAIVRRHGLSQSI